MKLKCFFGRVMDPPDFNGWIDMPSDLKKENIVEYTIERSKTFDKDFCVIVYYWVD